MKFSLSEFAELEPDDLDIKMLKHIFDNNLQDNPKYNEKFIQISNGSFIKLKDLKNAYIEAPMTITKNTDYKQNKKRKSKDIN